jgi:hypothetical protein
MEWILLILVQHGNLTGTLPSNAVFKTQTSCQNAAEELKKFLSPDVTIKTVCIKR